MHVAVVHISLFNNSRDNVLNYISCIYGVAPNVGLKARGCNLDLRLRRNDEKVSHKNRDYEAIAVV